MSASDGGGMSRLSAAWNRMRFGLRERLAREVRVSDGELEHRFRCGTMIELWRARSLRVKEQGTVRWIRDDVREGDVFYDVGANVGVYTLMAARRVGATGAVHAFEPHVGNVASLLRNVALNGLDDRVKVHSCALGDRDGWLDFHYASDVPGSSASQLDERRDELDQPFEPLHSECKASATVDALLAAGVVRPATLVKIDVDGNEWRVLRGMRGLLTGATPPRAVQVEVNARGKAELLAFLAECGYEPVLRHDTDQGARRIAKGRDPESIAYNLIFRPRGRAAVAGSTPGGSPSPRPSPSVPSSPSPD